MAKSLSTLKRELLADADVRAAYDEQAPEYAMARAVIAARIGAGLTQEQLAQRMNTAQSYVARLESGPVLPSMRTVLKDRRSHRDAPGVPVPARLIINAVRLPTGSSGEQGPARAPWECVRPCAQAVGTRLRP